MGISHTTGANWEKDNGRHGVEWRAGNESRSVPDAMPSEKLSGEAQAALEDFALFRRRYFGRIATPWQEQAAYDVLEWLKTPEKEFVVVNCPPGSGKSTLFTHDIPTWVICRNRGIRILLGSRTEKQAKWYTKRVRASLSRPQPVKGESEMVARGHALDAEAALCIDFGRFEPMAAQGDVWQLGEFTVAQLDDLPLENKESTVTAFGMDSGFLGGRYDLVLWDDLVDKSTTRTIEAKENQRKWWDDEAESRLEPGGLLILQGQRMAADDLYRHALDQTTEGDSPKYRHVVYKAHYEDQCTEDHGWDVPAWPEGCLLDPRRLPWMGAGGLATIQKNRMEKFRVLYQQEDIDPANVLVNPGWITGGQGANGEYHPGCWDKDRDLCELPWGLAGEILSIATADPSPTKFWSVQWWCVRVDHEGPQERFLMDLIRQGMDAPDFLDWNHQGKQFSGVMEEWQARSRDLGWPITHWIVEQNAAQRFLLQYDHVRRWQRKWGVDIIGHETQRNKSDTEYGVETIAPHYRYGRIRLPGKQTTQARTSSMKLVDEVTRYPEATTNDCVMAHWFLEWRLPQLAIPHRDPVVLKRPSWLRRAS